LMFLLLQHGEHVGTVCGENESRSIRQSLFHAVPATTTRSPRARELKKQAPLNSPNDDRSRPNDVERVRTRPNARASPLRFEKKSIRAFTNHASKRRSDRASIARTFITVRIPHANNASSRLVCSKAPMHKNLSITSTMGSHRVGPFRIGGPPFPESLLVDSPPFKPPGSLAGRRWCPQVSHVVPGACSCPHAAHIGDDPDSLSDRRIGRRPRPSSPESESDVAGARVILWRRSFVLLHSSIH